MGPPAAGVRGNANVAVYGNDRFVVVWMGTGTSGAEIYGRTFSMTTGKSLTGVFQVNLSTSGNQRDPAVEWISANQFVVTWTGTGSSASEPETVYARVMNGNGTGAPKEITVPDTKTGTKQDPVVNALPGGGFQIAWDGNGPGDPNGIFSRQFTSAGVKVGRAEFRVNTTTVGSQMEPAIAGNADQIVIAWQSKGNPLDPAGLGIVARRFPLDGSRASNEFLINQTTGGNQSDPSIALLADKGIVAAWRTTTLTGDGIYQREFNPDGTPRLGERKVNKTDAGAQAHPTIAAQAPAGYAVVWAGKIVGDSQGIGMQRYGDPLMPTLTSDNKLVEFKNADGSSMGIFPEVLYLKPGQTDDPTIPMKTFTLHNSSNLTIYPFLEDANATATKDGKLAKYDPYDPMNQEYRGYIGYKDPTTGRFFLGLKPGDTYTFQVPLAFWDAGRMHVTTDAQYLVTPGFANNQNVNPFKYYDIDPFSNKPTARYMEDTSLDGSNGRIMWYHARSKTTGLAEGVGLDAPTQLTEFTIRDPIMGATNFKSHGEIAASEKRPLINYDVSYVDSMVLPIAMEATDVQPYPPQQYGGHIQLDNGQATNTLIVDVPLLSNLLFKGMAVSSVNGDLDPGTLIDKVDDKSMSGKTVVTLTKNGTKTAGQTGDFFFLHPQPTAAFGWTGASQTYDQLQAAIKQFSAPNKPSQNNNGLGQYFDGNGYPQFYNPDTTLSGVKLPSGQNLPGQSPLKAPIGGSGPASNYDSRQFIVTSNGTAPVMISPGGRTGPFADQANDRQLFLSFGSDLSLDQIREVIRQLNEQKDKWTITTAETKQKLPNLKIVGDVYTYAGAPHAIATLVDTIPQDLQNKGFTFNFTRPVTDYASTRMANIWYSWAKHYVDAVTTKFGAGYTKDIPNGTISLNTKDNLPNNEITVSGDLTSTLAAGMVVSTKTDNVFPAPTADDPNVRVTILGLQYDTKANTTTIYLSKRPVGRANGAAIPFTVSLPDALTPKDAGVTTFGMSFTKDAAEAEKFAQSVYQLMEAMQTIPLFKNQGPDWLQVLTNCIGGNIGYIRNIGVTAGEKKYITTGYDGIANTIRTLIKSVLRGVSDFIAVPEPTGKWYPDPSLTGDKTGQMIDTGTGMKTAPYNVLNLDPFVWFVHRKLGLSGYGFSLDDDVADVSGDGASTLAISAGGLKTLPQQAQWVWGAPYGPVNSKTAEIYTYSNPIKPRENGLKVLKNLDSVPLPPLSAPVPLGLLAHGTDPDTGPGAFVYGPGVPIGTLVYLPIPFSNELILDTRVPADTQAPIGPFNFRGTAPEAVALAVSGQKATLVVQGTEGLFGEADWTYTWSLVDGPAGVTAAFSPNGTNVAKKTILTLSANTPGTYVLQVKITDKIGGVITRDVSVKVV
ncbi:MAG: hypothetical protein U0797_25150 [Gemmataceae bacterium]